MIVRMRPDPDLSKFLTEITRHPVLSKAEQSALLTLAKAGNEDARRKLCAHNLKFVIRVALKFRGAGLPFKDLVHEGTLGMIDAANRFDQSTGNRFISYAVWWIRQAILKAITDTSRTVRISAEHEASIRRLKRAKLNQVIGGSYLEDVQEEARRSGIQAEYLDLSLNASRGGLSLDQPVTQDGSTPAEIIPSTAPQPDELTEAREQKDIVKRLRGKLTPIQRQVITLCYGLDDGHRFTLRQVGDKLNLSGERVRQIKDQAILKMRSFAGKYARE